MLTTTSVAHNARPHAGLLRAGRVTNAAHAGAANELQTNTGTPGEAGKKVNPAVTCFWRAMCHVISPEDVAQEVSEITVDPFSYELVSQIVATSSNVAFSQILHLIYTSFCCLMTWATS